MFDNLKNLANLPGIMQKAREMQERMQQVQADLAQKQVSADAGGGMVTAIVNGRMEVVRVRIDKTKLPDVNDTEMLEDLIVAAVSAAQQKAAEMTRQEMQRAATDLGLPPGM